jgi:hypothetical protein
MPYEQFKADIAAFADDENEIIVQRDGQFIFPRGGKEITARLSEEAEGRWVVDVEGSRLPYRRFVGSYLARLDVFAERILAKRSPLAAFVDGRARLESVVSGATSGRAMELLDAECRTHSPFSAKVVFVTADAGHGKTVLLREYQAQQALLYLDGKSPFVFWHVDLQGRQLLRLSEALLGDLGDLRMSGLYMSGIVRLLHHRMLVLAIDGFDELAAEQGTTDALGALSTLVRQIQDRGTIVAASRRTFFDTEDYSRRTGLLRTHVSSQCEFDQLHLKPWTEEEAVQFLGSVKVDNRSFARPADTYANIVEELGGNPEHPMVTRPFLLSHVARGLLLYNATPSEFIRGMHNPFEGVASVVQAFVQREVSEKWKYKDTGEPYLTIDQHMTLLAAVAEEMWRSQVERLDVEAIETIAAVLLEHWNLDPGKRRQVVDMVKMHVLLTIPVDGDARFRAFDHPEFRNYFVAFALATTFNETAQREHSDAIGRFLSLAQLPDSVARYACSLIDRTRCDIGKLVLSLAALVQREWRPTYLQANVGTLVPQLLNGYEPATPVIFDAKVAYSSLVFENIRLKNVTIANGTFIRTSFADVDWEDVCIRTCVLSEVAVSHSSRYQNVVFSDCDIQGIRVVDDSEEEYREYSPPRVVQVLNSFGIAVETAGVQQELAFAIEQEGDFHKLVRRFLRVFRRITGVTEHVIEIRYRSDQRRILEEVLPLMEQYGIVINERRHGGGPPQSRWLLQTTLEDLLRADGGPGPDNLVNFWKDIGTRDR